ncbi:hypothetical protein WMY93_025516 [Mugilogobius chulae]|uniref:Sulfotransferase n=1 Tax=Mugilogobius chulae TaxID=88201 RepID=A0AAW0N0L3_9GOBI
MFIVPELHNPEELDQIQDLEIRDTDVFVVTYPKSGTIWLQQILLLLQFKELHHSRVSTPQSDPPAVPLHAHRAQPQEGQGDLRGQKSKDVLVSFYHFQNAVKVLETDKSFDEVLERFLGGRVPGVGKNWFEHIKTWFSHKDDLNMLFITYEEMIQDLTSVIKKIADFLETELTQDQLQNVVKHSTFKNMKKIPQANYEQASKLMDKQQGSFMRKGTIGDWKNHFTVAQNERFDKIFAEEMKDFPVSFIWDETDAYS